MATHVDEQLFIFPPFPDPPPGVTIVPFGTFVPKGYNRVAGPSGEWIEVDAWAEIPTVKVSSEEDVSKKRKAKRRRRLAGNATDASGRSIPWWEEWEEGEATRGMSESSFDGHMRLEDRVCLAADDFRVGRTWPEIAQGVRLLWDQFRLYIGLISSIPLYKKVRKCRGQVDGPGQAVEGSEEEDEAPKAKETRVVIVQDYLEQGAQHGKQLEPSPDESTLERKRLRAFLSDMEKTVKIFLSSYMRDTGLIWTERNSFIAPTVLHFFLRFMLRNKVFADSEGCLDNLRRAVAVAALAQKELPLTAKHGQILPGQFDLACRECWGTKGCTSIQISSIVPPASEDDTPKNSASEAAASETSSAFETELKESNVEIVSSDVVLDSITARQVMEDNLDTDQGVPVTTIPVAGDPWMAAISAEECTTASWTDVSVPWLMPLLGPSVFPMRMTTGVVEFSTRRIREVMAPATKETLGGASIVEEALEERFFRVVLSPWVKSAEEGSMDFPRPVIVVGSTGAEIPEVEGDSDAWNPYRDEVTVLVDENAAKDMVVGMGLYGTWVEMVPDGAISGRYWYIETLVASVPSYYTEGEPMALGEEEEVELN